MPLKIKVEMKVIFIFLITLSFTSLNAQHFWIAAEFPLKDSTLKSIKFSHNIQLKKYGNIDDLEKVYNWRYNYINNLLEAKAVIYDESLYNYIDSIFNVITKSNPKLQSMEFRFFISNSPIPNAASIGDGTFIINLGLIRKLDNEAQLAFVICHEISHFYLDHSNQSVLKRHEKAQSKIFQKELDSIAAQKYGRNNMMKSMLKNNIYSQMNHSRLQEMEADSLGLVFFKNTIYNPTQSITCMNLLDTIDFYKYHEKINYNKSLSFENYPFRNRWLESETSMFGGPIEENYWDRDSIKSHPDCKIRSAFLKNSLLHTKVKVQNNYLQDSAYFASVKEQADYEFINSWIYYEDYGHALFFCLKQLESNQNDTYLLIKVSQIFKLIYDSQINHQYSKYVERPSPNNEKEYNQFLDFLDNIRLSEFANLSYHYHLAHFTKLNQNKIYLANYNYFKTQTSN